MFTGKVNSMEIPLSLEDIEQRLSNGKLIQDAFPELTSEQREFLQSGCNPKEWDELFKDIEED